MDWNKLIWRAATLATTLTIFFLLLTVLTFWGLNTSEKLNFFIAIFTGGAALATAYAAKQAAKSAEVSERASKTWKHQMALDVELKEAKKIKVALMTYYRHFINEAHKYHSFTYSELVSDLEHYKKTDPKEFSNFIHKYSSQSSALWSELEAAFDEASFVKHDFEELKRYRISQYRHNASCEYLMVSFLKPRLEFGSPELKQAITGVYRVKDWNDLYFRNENIMKVQIEIRDDDESFKSIDAYCDLFEDVAQWHVQIASRIDRRIEEIKNKLSTEL
ncbi:hypothetical protein [Thalassomonas actiniarum]|uniref:Uncharacterized protein n=1 Tax=Thalassomonas actiniarum TaxID=485447 RepID=A0AAE9YNT3_9GAMM|nr:hypothetical protein [Thalassomonas actiniarum]WDD96776.1 hypothetical protein SG35_015475 [Thalassomonas actiniarum]